MARPIDIHEEENVYEPSLEMIAIRTAKIRNDKPHGGWRHQGDRPSSGGIRHYVTSTIRGKVFFEGVE